MTQHVGERRAARGGGETGRLAIEWAVETNEEGGPTRWFGSWLVSAAGDENMWFYSGHGDERTEHIVPAEAVGVRIRKWVSEGLDPEYVDIPLHAGDLLRTAELDFDSAQPHRLLAAGSR